jgi:hypothetical protein
LREPLDGPGPRSHQKLQNANLYKRDGLCEDCPISMTSRRVCGVFAVFCAIAFTASHPAHAQSTDDAQLAQEIKRRGDEAITGGRPAEALAAYNEAYAITKDPALLYNRGRAYMALTEFPQALEQIEAFDKGAPAELKAKVPGLERLLLELRQKVTNVEITCDVPGATVRLRDRTLGTTPIAGLVKVNSGPAVIEITKDGYFPYKKELSLPNGGLVPLDVRLVSQQTSGFLVVKSAITGSTVSVDGAPKGTVPSEVVVTAGTHQVSVAHEGYRTATSSVVVAAGERKELDLSLEAEKGILSKWWFWTGIGVVAAGGVGTYFALTTEKSAEKGTIAPGIISAGSFPFRF